MKIMKKVLLTIFVLAVSAGIFTIYVRDQKLNKSVLQSALGVLGDQLFAMIPEGKQKGDLRNSYEEFLGRVKEKDVPPEQIEKVTAAILNETNSDSVSTAKLMDILSMSTRAFAALPDSSPLAKGPRHRPPKTMWSDREYNRLGERLKDVSRFQKHIMQDLPRYVPGHDVVFMADSGLKIIIDPNIQMTINAHVQKDLQNFMAELEKQNVLRIMTKQKILDELHQSEKPEYIVTSEFWQQKLDSLNVTLENLNADSLQKALSDSIQKTIERSLEAVQKVLDEQ